MPPYKKTDKRQNNIIFLTILKDIYQQILDSDYKLLVWEQVLEECRSYGFNEDTTAEYLRRTRWPSIIRATRIKWEAKEKELDEKDIYIIGIERMRKPDFCFPMNEEEAMQNPDDPMADVAESQSYTQDDEFFDATDD
uniref:Uncharacterized protein n=1 Tax=Panagrolaimus sp. PS1159 TaxID=55785 RepID=A0AC35FE88_9BILA